MAVAQDGPDREIAPLNAPTVVDQAPPNAHTDALAWYDRLFSAETGQPTVLGHSAIAAAILSAAAVVTLVLFGYASQRQQEWLSLEGFKKTEPQIQALVSNVEATPAERDRMADQFFQVQRRMEIHTQVVSLFYKLNFISLGTILVAVGIASISLFFISKRGWEQINNAVINVFIVSSGLVVFHSNLILVFKYQDNAQINQTLLSEYFKLRNVMLSYWATQRTLKDSAPAAEFIYIVDGKLAELSPVTLNFDTDQAAQLRQPIDYLPSTPRKDQ